MDRKQMKRALIGALLAGGLCGGAAMAERLPQALFEEAVLSETGDRDLDKALALYRQVLLQVSENDPLAVRAHLQIGLCLEKMGNANWEEAKAAFQKALTLSPDDSSEEAQMARAHLQGMEERTLARFSVPPAPEKEGWQFSTEFAQIGQDNPTIYNLNKNQPWLWVTAGRGISPNWRLGFEGAYITRVKEEERLWSITYFPSGEVSSYSQSSELTGFYAGPFLETMVKGRRLSGALGAGVGGIFTRLTNSSTYQPRVGPAENRSADFNDQDLALVFSASVSLQLVGPVHLKAGIRNLLVFPTIFYGDTFTENVFMPSIGLSAQF